MAVAVAVAVAVGWASACAMKAWMSATSSTVMGTSTSAHSSSTTSTSIGLEHGAGAAVWELAAGEGVAGSWQASWGARPRRARLATLYGAGEVQPASAAARPRSVPWELDTSCWMRPRLAGGSAMWSETGTCTSISPGTKDRLRLRLPLPLVAPASAGGGDVCVVRTPRRLNAPAPGV